MKRLLIAVPVLAGLVLVPLKAGWIVFDIQANAKLLDQISRMKDQIQWMRQQYEKQTQIYMQLYNNARYAMNKSRWVAAIESWRYPSYSNKSGKTAPWFAASTDGQQAAGAWTSVVSSLPNIVSANGRFGSPEVDDIKNRHFAMAEIMDGNGVNTLAIIGDVRSVQKERMMATADLERASVSDLMDENTEVTLLNKTVAASILSLRNEADALKLQTAQTEMQLMEQAAKQDAIAGSAHLELAFLDGHKKISKRLTGDTGQAIRGYAGF